MAEAFDLVVLGGGPGGYVAALRAAQLKMNVALVEREHLGGICLNWGCIPTKALLRTSEIYGLLKHLGDFGLSARDISFDIGKIVQRSRVVAGQLSAGVKHLLKKNKVTVFEGHARLAGKGKVAIEKGGENGPPAFAEATAGSSDQSRRSLGGGGELQAKHIIIATGARARQLPGMETDGKLVWSYKEAMVPKAMPKSLLVVGSGAIGIEFASFYRTLGVDVTVIEMLENILPAEDEEISTLARKAFEKQGMEIFTKAALKNLDKGMDNVSAHFEMNGKTEKITVERVIMAVGIAGNIENIGLENTRVKTEKSHIKVGNYSETEEPGIYAIGDVAGPPWLAHKASHEGIVVVEKIAGMKGVHPLNVRNVPGCTYSHPQVASIGLTEKAARAAKLDIRIGRFPFIGNGKAIALGEPEGLVKTIFDAKTGELLGAHMIGAEVTELIQGYAVARTLESTETELMHTIFPHPTLSEAMHEAVLAAYGRAIHI